MAHQLTVRKNNFVEFAALGNRTNVWHGLGQYLEEGQSIEQWQESAGMDWMVYESAVRFNTIKGQSIDNTRKVLYRSDTEDVLGVVSSDYHVVQPSEILEFFREFTNLNKMKLSAAGTLFGGKRFWATAELGKDAYIVDGDKIEGYLLLTTSADGTLSTQAKFTSTRVVCNNTLTVALNQKDKYTARCTHLKKWDANEFKINMNLIDQGWDNFVANLKNLANQKVEEQDAKEFFDTLINPKKDSDERNKIGYVRQFDAMMHFYKHGAGSEFSYGTKWGLLNAVTELQTHGSGKRDQSHQFDVSEFGKGDTIKTKALEMLI